MIDRQDVFSALFKLKNAGVDVQKQLDLMARNKDIPKEVIIFLRDNSPQFQFFRYIQKYQKALFKGILNYEEAETAEKVKLCSSLITRAMIAVEYKNIDESLIDELNLSKVTSALDKAFKDRDYSNLDKVLDDYKQSMLLFVSNKR